MYRIISKIAILAALVAGLSSCELGPIENPDNGPVTFSIQMNSEEEETKSSYSGGEATVNNFKVFIYQSGSLVNSGYSSDASALSFTLSPGSYTFYAVCNTGDSPSSLGSSPDSYRFSITSTASMLSGGLPMAGKKTATVTASTTSVVVDVTRLVAKYSLYVQRSFTDENSTFTVTGVKVCQAAADVLAFSSNSTPNSVLSSSYGDAASSADITCLNSSTAYNSTTGAVYFYMLENAQGTLLSGNTDPWKKCYDSYGGLLSSSDAADCTYLEVTGTWASPGIQESMTYRMYLGADNCTNFDVVRNTQSVVTLQLTDGGKDRASWKVENEEDFDERSLAWQKTSMQIYRSSSYTTTLTVSPSDLSHDIYYASNPSSPSWQKLTATTSGHVGYTDNTNLVTVDYNLSTHLLTMTATSSSSITSTFTFLMKAQTLDAELSSSMTVNVALGGEVDYTFSKNYYYNNAKWVYSNCPCVLDFGSSSLESTVTIKYAIYDSTTGAETSSTNTYSVYTSTVRSSTFYFDPSVNRAYYYNSVGTGSNGHIYYLRVYLNGTLCEEHEIHQLWSWFVPTGSYVYSSSDFLDQSDEDNPPTLFVTNMEQVELKVYDPVDYEILSPKLLYLPQNFVSSGSTSYAHLLEEWDYNDMDENGITYDMEEEDPEDHNLTFTFTKTSNGETSYWNLGYNYTAQNACLNIQTAGSIPSGGVTEVNIIMPLMLDNACAGSTTGQSTVAVDFSSVISSNPNSGPTVAPQWLKFDDISSYGYLPSYSSSSPEDPYSLSISYSKTSSTAGQLTFRKCFCGDLVLYWEDVTYGSSGKTGYRYNFTFKVRSVFELGGIYVPVYVSSNNSSWSWNFFGDFAKSAYSPYNYYISTRKGLIRRYPLAKNGTYGQEVFESLVSSIRQPDYYNSSVGSQQWLSYEDYSSLSTMLNSVKIKSTTSSGTTTYSINPTSNTVTDYVGSYNWATNNNAIEGYVIQEYSGPGGSGEWVTSTVSASNLTQIYTSSPLTVKLSNNSLSSALSVGQSYEYSNASSHLYIKVTNVNEFYNDRFDAWAWNQITY